MKRKLIRKTFRTSAFQILAQEGAYVIVNYNGSKEAAEAVVETITAAGGQAETWQCSVADFAAVEEMIKSIYKKFGHIDVLVNNAGITKDNLLMKMKEEEFDAVIDTNLKGSFNTMRHIARYMLKQKSGSIINISSVSGVLGNPGQMNYCASKAGVIHMSKSLAIEWAEYGIRVNSLSPGYIATPMSVDVPKDLIDAWIPLMPMHRMGKPEELIPAVLYLASDASGYTTGSDIIVDGGYSVQ